MCTKCFFSQLMTVIFWCSPLAAFSHCPYTLVHAPLCATAALKAIKDKIDTHRYTDTVMQWYKYTHVCSKCKHTVARYTSVLLIIIYRAWWRGAKCCYRMLAAIFIPPKALHTKLQTPLARTCRRYDVHFL